MKKEVNKGVKIKMATIMLTYLIFFLFSVIAPNSKGLISSTNSVATAPISSSNLGGSANITSSTIISMNTQISQPDIGEGSIKLPFTPVSTPVIEQAANGSWIRRNTLRAGQNHWWSIDYWTSTWGGYLPSKMNGTFVAVANTISGLESSDVVMYLPLNVAYGVSSSNFVWFQFVVYFKAGGITSWRIWAFPNGTNGKDFTISNISYTQDIHITSH
jgi:hypothetical protein